MIRALALALLTLTASAASAAEDPKQALIRGAQECYGEILAVLDDGVSDAKVVALEAMSICRGESRAFIRALSPAAPKETVDQAVKVYEARIVGTVSAQVLQARRWRSNIKPGA